MFSTEFTLIYEDGNIIYAANPKIITFNFDSKSLLQQQNKL